MRRLPKEEHMVELIRTGKMLVVSEALLAFFQLSEHKVKIVDIEGKEKEN